MLAAVLLLGACTVGPDYERPRMAVPSGWGDSVQPDSRTIADDWWTMYGDVRIDGLVALAIANNREIAAAVVRFDEARAILGTTEAQQVPNATGSASSAVGRTSGAIDNRFPRLDTTVHRAVIDTSYEIDLWGRVRRSVASAQFELEGSASAHDAIRLSVIAETVTIYLQIASLDREAAALRRAVTLRSESLDLAALRERVGATSPFDALRARSELAQARADLDEVLRQRMRSEHALAVLIGRPSPDFAQPDGVDQPTIPTVPVGLPSALLERRPDIDQKERLLRAASERIGVAESARFPAIRLTGSGGVASADLSHLLTANASLWSLGPAITLPLFDGGRIQSDIALAEARFREAGIAYQLALLTAFREVSDALGDRTYLANRATQLQEAVDAARIASELARLRYERGAAGFLDVIDAERTQVVVERLQIQNDRAQLAASVSLIKSLGGGWRAEGRGAVRSEGGSP